MLTDIDALEAAMEAEAEYSAPRGVKHLDWLNAMSRAVLAGQLKPGLMGHAAAFAASGVFHLATGRQHTPLSPKALAGRGGPSRSTWETSLGALVDAGWLTRYAQHWQAPGSHATPLYLLTVPEIQG